ncbi:MAG: peptidase M75 [Bacteroidaceae bacterium]|nr:peptidase M75 [Bacteroidaceae bacterium]
MKKNVFMISLLAMSVGFTACNKDNETPEITIPEGTANVTIEENNIDVTSKNINTWTQYATAVVNLLAKDASDLNKAWSESYNGGEAYAETFKNFGGEYRSAAACVQQIVDGCIDIAGEVGTAKIGEPRDLWEAGKYTEAVYAVESWYSWHSIDDYSNNIISIRNAFNGTLNNQEAAHSLAAFTKAKDATLYNNVKTKIEAAYNTIKSMNAPFRSHIGSASVTRAQNACAELVDVLEKDMTSFISQNADDEELKNIVSTYVDQVVLPTYANLVSTTTALRQAIVALSNNPSSAAFKNAANLWIEAREPWETSEAFLFGPVADLGLDPNMDSWPLDVDAIKGVMESGKIEELIKWEGEYDEDNEDIEAVQNVRGFHTLEFLLFKNGKARTY